MKKKKKKSNKKIILFLIIISIFVILAGTYLLYLSNPKRIFSQAINNINSRLNKFEYLDLDYSNHTINSNVEIRANGDLKGYKVNDNFYYKYISNIIKNYNQTNVKIDYTKNLNKKSLFINYDSKNNNDNLISGKYLIEDNTEYYYVNGLTPTYINNGNNTYFESISNSISEEDNIKYLNSHISTLLKKEVDNNYFIKTTSKGYTVITLNLDNNKLNKIYKKVINGLKQDNRSREILMGYDRDFFKKNKKKIKFLNKDDKLSFNFYTDNILYNIYKYEIILNNDKFVYSKGNFNFYKNNKLKIKGEIVDSSNRLNISFLNNRDKKIGNLNITKKKNNKKILFYMNDNNMKNTINININKHQIKKNSYKKDVKILISGTDNNKDIYNVNMIIKNKISDAEKIREDISKSHLNSSLDSDTKDKINNKINNIIDNIRK